ncbi:MAG: thioredoxin domain-containing protein [Chromatiales bacterium]|nr:thioredoxin domain-containing protein [Chromatiales bacterium]
MNYLASETSPYLLQHATNPVDWHPWNEAALAKARDENKPILLSIGYSACHWCHVMAHESFEDPATAEVMNRHFVNIKVDREERPDLDRIYQTAHHFIAQRGGGWPLTMFLTPEDHVPFFGGTYFPNTAKYGMPSFTQVLERVAGYYRDHAADVRGQADALREAFRQLEPGGSAAASALNGQPLADFREVTGQQVDREHGGFGGAPKFPHPTTIDRLLRHWRGSAHEQQPDKDALFFAALTLKRMAEGGIYDHLGGGFCRYSVDRFWTIPHFEKMLYDNGPLLALYAQMFQISGDESFRTVARETADWVLREMRSPDGGFWSSLDADSEGEEGKFYTWTPEQVRELVDPDEYAVLAPRFGLDQPPNFEEPHHHVRAWHLRVYQTVEQVAEGTGQPVSTVRRLLMSGRSKLLAARNRRVWPGLDDKLLTSWNALMIRGLAIAGRVLDRPDLVDAAAAAVDFLRASLVVEGQVRATFKDGRARLNGYLDDYAFLLDAVVELLQARWNTAHLRFAIQLADGLLERFEDRENGGFWFTSHDHEILLHRSKPLADEAVPSGNGVAACALARLGYLLVETRYLDAAERTLRAAWRGLQEFPHGHCSLLNALDEYLQPPELIVLRGDAREADRWAATLGAAYNPRRLVFAIPGDAGDLPAGIASKAAPPAPSSVLAYVCRGTTCESPLDSLDGVTGRFT